MKPSPLDQAAENLSIWFKDSKHTYRLPRDQRRRIWLTVLQSRVKYLGATIPDDTAQLIAWTLLNFPDYELTEIGLEAARQNFAFKDQTTPAKGGKRKAQSKGRGGRKHDGALLIRRALVVATQDHGITGPTPIAQKIEAFADWLEEERQRWDSNCDHIKMNVKISRDRVKGDLAQMAKNPELRNDAKRAGTKWGGIEVFKRYLEETDL